MQKKRNYGVDLLRIVLMFCIVVGHLYAHTEIRSLLPFLSGKWVFTWTTQAVTVCAVDCFVVITGYYMSQADFDLYKLACLWSKVVFYSVFTTIIAVLIKARSVSFGVLLDAFFPVFRKEYWFFTMYILLYLLSPFLNIGLRKMSKRMHGALALIILVFFYVEPLLSAVFYEFDPTEGFSITGFVTLYIIGAYLARCPDIQRRYCVLALAVSSMLMTASKIGFQLIADRYGPGLGTGLLYHNNSVFVLINAAALFALFKQLDLKPVTEKAVAWISPAVFAVYLLHEKPAIREVLWNKALAERLCRVGLPAYILIVLGIGFGVLAAGVLLDKLAAAAVFSPAGGSRTAQAVKRLCNSYNRLISR